MQQTLYYREEPKYARYPQEREEVKRLMNSLRADSSLGSFEEALYRSMLIPQKKFEKQRWNIIRSVHFKYDFEDATWGINIKWVLTNARKGLRRVFAAIKRKAEAIIHALVNHPSASAGDGDDGDDGGGEDPDPDPDIPKSRLQLHSYPVAQSKTEQYHNSLSPWHFLPWLMALVFEGGRAA